MREDARRESVRGEVRRAVRAIDQQAIRTLRRGEPLQVRRGEWRPRRRPVVPTLANREQRPARGLDAAALVRVVGPAAARIGCIEERLSNSGYGGQRLILSADHSCIQLTRAGVPKQ